MAFEYNENGDGVEVVLSYENQKTTAQENTLDKIIVLLKENPKYTKNDLKRILNQGDGAIKEYLVKLKKYGRIRRVGSTKAGHWEVIKKK